ncbi:unnamed protein product [Parnassius apollo]|uniref:(apollo) hypothetical protein n=1 Tax=Parnassius apollo TaxID=110799 RepID=A0A8S3WKB2_PARAO|nr:unnamed protein product [Parnassius apollo]
MGFKTLEEFARTHSSDIILKITEKRDAFLDFIESPINRPDVFALMMEILSKVCQSSFDSLKLKILIEVCESQFLVNLQGYLMNLPYESRKSANMLYWNNQAEFWNNFLFFCESLTNASPSTALRKCRSLIEGTTKFCLDGLNERHNFRLPEENIKKWNELRERLTLQEQSDEVKQKTKRFFVEKEESDPPENFRDLSVIPTCDDLLERRPFVRPNIVDGAYKDIEHYLDVQFRLLREDCFGPLREGIRQYIKEPSRHKYDNIRTFQNVKFLEPYISQLKFGYLVQLDQKITKRFKKINWAHSKRFIYGSLVLFTKDRCKSFLIGTILDREVKYMVDGKIPISLVNEGISADICYNNETYTMIESEVYFEPYYHVLNALKDPKFPDDLAMRKYIVSVDPEPKLPSYLTPSQTYKVNSEDFLDILFTIDDNQTWPSNEQLGLNESQYEAFKLALTHEFSVIQGPPGTGKTFLGVKVATALLQNFQKHRNKCVLLLICYTNHALDQFLEAILPITESIARIGGQSRSERMMKYNIANLRHTFCKQHSRHMFTDERTKVKTLHNELKYAQERFHRINNDVLSYDCVKRYVPESILLQQFYKNGDKDPLHQWLFENINYDAEQFTRNDLEEENNLMENDEDNPILKRDDTFLDDLNDDNDPGINKILEHITFSFSLDNTILEIRNLDSIYNKTEKENQKRGLFAEMHKLTCHIQLFREMSAYRRQAKKVSLQLNNPTLMTTEERWCLYFNWADVVKTHLLTNMEPLQLAFVEASAAYEEARMVLDQELLKGVNVIGMTTSGAARLRKLLKSIAPPIVIVEEAAEVLEQHIITSLTRHCQHLILIGDHQQLRPSAAHMKLAKHYNIEVSLFERMIMNNIHSRRLEVQHRMRPEISALISPHIYVDLKNHPSVENFPDVRGMTSNVFFFTHDYKENDVEDTASKSNQKEADMVLGLANYLILQDYAPEDITILSAYSGQMFYMRKNRSLYPHLSKVKITVVDNYQGEESKIILLSLVRNNDQNKIGFLGTENRICVALSRAREGFYLFGNIDILRKNSELWEKIALTLENNGSIGKTLKLRCEGHRKEITLISNAQDFKKVPEGGCMLKCTANLSCGHQCPLMCHGYDRGHVTTQCILRCERILCENGHVCPLECKVPCEPCKVMVLKKLPCGHDMSLPCHLETTDESVMCVTKVTVTLPNCGHEAKKACYLETKNVICLVPCIYRVEKCGHKCTRTCHVSYDPNHEKYVCPRPCAKAKKGCTANLIGDRGDHQCPRKCHEDCDLCTVEVIKKRSNCKHSERVPCNKDVNETPCLKKCSRSLPCGHFCKKKCSENCGDCKVKITKSIPGCQHTIEIECDVTPTRELCTQKCSRTLSCGHPCAGMCKDECDLTSCRWKIRSNFDSPCGHKVQLPCNVYRASTTGIPEDVYLSNCDAPCTEILACGHLCQGTCSECLQGRLHVPCKQICHQMNVCGHQCKEPCNQVCPPCKLQCEVECVHSRCNKLCGERCVPCQEECGRRCKHGACSRRCGEPCAVAPCSAACERALPCGHACRGLCGEPCPDICNVCRPDDFPKDFLGDDYDDDAKFIQLQDCQHVMELENMDTLMTGDKETIGVRQCPFCRKPIINTNRYKDLVYKMMVTEINPVKERVYGNKRKIKMRQNELCLKLEEFSAKHNIENAPWRKTFLKLKEAQKKLKKMSLLSLDMIFINLDILEMVSDIYKKHRLANSTELESELVKHIERISKYLYSNIHKISQQQQKDIGNEIKRLDAISQLSKIMSHDAFKASKSNTAVEQAFLAARELILGWRIYDEERALQSLQRLQKTVKVSGIVTKQERDLIVKAIGLKAGHWFKCPNGHFYCIGECGGAMEVSKCVECGAAIGGRSHTLLNTNTLAPEVDGARFAAWSDQYNNMANFDFN